ncbi:H-2 class I histocompatibility antigen, Q10 alpha chain-like [Syngnathus scovelli]|uniref:H-2 class I histocompatibility antigen, Q10 alpha chain-like n=1 Tax=Syngnathus scovelli TaxID=161590 RepID=UPI002110834E|nr:H-2 class I histocompatibility antigen, Q10 alpha chain-like [Syngnathus scovelli]
MIVKSLLFLVLSELIPDVTPVIHTLKYFRTASTNIASLPAYIEVGYVDGVEFIHYDSDGKKAEAKQDWMERIIVDDPDYWEMETQRNSVNERVFQTNFKIAQARFNQTGGVHILQWMFGCEWNDETDETEGWNQHSYDGEDFISLDTKTMTYVAANAQAFITKLKWDRDQARKDYRKLYYTDICPALLKKLLNYGHKALMRTELPKVSLLQKTPSSPVTCHASGFYPYTADLFWRKDGEQLHEDVDYGQTLPNHDGTFQMTVDLKVTPTAEEEGRYECVFGLAGVEDEIITKLDRRNILSNTRNEDDEKKKIITIVSSLVVVALVVLLVAIVIIIVRRRDGNRDDYTAASKVEFSKNGNGKLRRTNVPTEHGQDVLMNSADLPATGPEDNVPVLD